MKRILVSILALALLSSASLALGGEGDRREEGNLVIEGIPEIPPRIVERLVQYTNTRSAYASGWSADGTGIYISTRFGETSQIHYIEKPGGMRKQITFFSEPVNGVSVCPDQDMNGFLFGKDVGGGEFYQIFWFDAVTGKYRMLTDGESRNGGFSWSNGGDKFVYYTTARNGRDWDLRVQTVDGEGEAKSILEAGGVWFAQDWSPDDSRLIVGRYISANESYAYILDVGTGELEQVNESDKKISYGGAMWTKDGEGVYYTSDEDTEFMHLRLYDPKSGRSKILTGDIEWDINGFNISHSGETLVFTSNEDGIEKLYIMDSRTGKYKQVPGIPPGWIAGMEFSPDDSKLAMTLGTAGSTGDLYVLEVSDLALERWTFSEIGGLDTEGFCTPSLIHYETFDKVEGRKRQIPAFYFKPGEGDGPYPVVIYIHGGPEGQFTPYFSTMLQYIIGEMGIAVLAPNVRGSSGYGKTYLKLDNGFKREDSVKDIGYLIDWIAEQPELDKSRICVYGGSYGGYMVYASMIHYNEKVRCGIDVVGISNFVTFLENTKEYRRDLRRVEYGDERDPEMREHLEKISPTTNAKEITKPIFIIQGLNDPRVPVTEAEQMLEAVRSNGVEAWYLLAKDEGHGFRKKKNRDYMYHSMILFLEEYLLK
jgi:dipeptidyl aminopeptidase/acylaminoacyl peptidase